MTRGSQIVRFTSEEAAVLLAAARAGRKQVYASASKDADRRHALNRALKKLDDLFGEEGLPIP